MQFINNIRYYIEIKNTGDGSIILTSTKFKHQASAERLYYYLVDNDSFINIDNYNLKISVVKINIATDDVEYLKQFSGISLRKKRDIYARK